MQCEYLKKKKRMSPNELVVSKYNQMVTNVFILFAFAGEVAGQNVVSYSILTNILLKISTILYVFPWDSCQPT